MHKVPQVRNKSAGIEGLPESWAVLAEIRKGHVLHERSQSITEWDKALSAEQWSQYE